MVKLTFFVEGMKEPVEFIGGDWDVCIDEMFNSGALQMEQYDDKELEGA